MITNSVFVALPMIDDSFEQKLDQTIKEGQKDVEDGKKYVGGNKGKRSHNEMLEMNFAEEDEFKGILSQCAHELQVQICALPHEQRIPAFNNFLNGWLARLPVLQQQIVTSQPTNSEKFSKLKAFVDELTKKEKKAKS